MKKDLEYVKQYNEYYKDRQQIECDICSMRSELLNNLKGKYTEEQITSFHQTKNILNEPILVPYLSAGVLLVPLLITLTMIPKNSLDFKIIILFGSCGIVSLFFGIRMHIKQYKIKELFKESISKTLKDGV